MTPVVLLTDGFLGNGAQPWKIPSLKDYPSITPRVAKEGDDYKPYAGDIPKQRSGSILAHEQGEAIPYALAQYEDRGVFFVTPKTKVYRGMIIGECNKPQDIVVNICKTKKLTNMRSATADVMVTLQAHKEMSLEECMEYIGDDELVEITPENVRFRKADLTRKIYN